MTYWTWSGHNNELPTIHMFGYGLFNIWDDGLTNEEHWLDADPPTLKLSVLNDLEEWGGEWLPKSLEIRFSNDNDTGATLWKLKYASKTGCTSPEPKDLVNSDGVIILQGTGLGKIL